MDFLEKYGIYIKNKDLLLQALTHTSYANEHNTASYERLEFLGDAVLQFIMSEYFYLNTNYPEGTMSKKRASFVCENALYEYSKEIGYAPYIRVGNGQISDINATILADIFESILGVIYLDQGIEVAKKYIYDIIVPDIKKNKHFLSDYKSSLQELVQTDQKTLTYTVIKESGPAHDKTFTVEVKIDDMVYGIGTGKSKKEAEQNAAKDAYQKQAKH